MKTSLLIQIILLFSSLISIGQPRQFTAVTPEAAALAKEVNYPVNYNTGIPDIRIPLYEIKSGDLSLPVDLVYHSGGFRINEQSTRVGLGWSLSTDLQITRTVNGIDDLGTYGYINNPLVKAYYPAYCYSCEYPSTHLELYPLATGEKDASPDKFNYKLLNKSGSFYFQKNEYGTSYSIVSVPWDNIKIEYSSGQFIITDTDGTKYYFGDPITGTGDINYFLGKKNEINNNGGTLSIRTAWKCSKIVNAQNVQEISFSYATKSKAIYKNFKNSVEYYENENPCYLQEYDPKKYPMNFNNDYDALPTFYKISTPKYMVDYGDNTMSYFHVPYVDANDDVADAVYERNNTMYGTLTPYQNIYGLSVSQINFRGGKVVFSGNDHLSYIKIVDASDVELKTIYFYQSYTPPAYLAEARLYNGQGFSGTYYLDSIQIKNGGATYERYALDYESKFCFGNHLTGQDAWGNVNQSTMEIADASSNNILVLPTINETVDKLYDDPYYCIYYKQDVALDIINNNGAELPNEDYMKKGVLRRIVYPTGGYTDFNFEANRYNEVFIWDNEYNILPQIAGGLRIKTINTHDKTGALIGQKYFRYGILEDGTGEPLSKPPISDINNGFTYSASSYEQDIVYLETVGSWNQACPDKSCLNILAVERKTIYQPSSVLDYTYGTGAPVYYEKVTEYNQDLGKETGKTVYEYYPHNEFIPTNTNIPPDFTSVVTGTNISVLRTDAFSGMLKSEKKYRFNTNAKSYETDKMYELVYKKEMTYQRYLRPEWVRVNYSFMRTIYDINPKNWAGTHLSPYDESINFLNYNFPGQTYNFNFGEYGIPIGRVLPDQIRETYYKNKDSIYTLTKYYYDKLPHVQPSKITTYDSKGSKIEKKIKYANSFTGTSAYNTMVSRNMVDIPIEEIVTNIDLNNKEISRHKTEYEQFAVGSGVIAPGVTLASVNGNALDTLDRYQKYDSYGNVLQMTGQDGVPVSYLWGYNYLYPVAELRGRVYDASLSSYQSNSRVINPVSDADLRSFLSGLSVTGGLINYYTHRPLAGMSSHTDPNSITTYYEYDPVGRLIASKDNEGKVLQKYQYSEVKDGLFSGAKSYANVPVMHSHNAPGAGFWYFYNKVVEGGKYNIGVGQAYADYWAIAEAEDGTGGATADVPPSNTMVDVALVYLDDDYDGIEPIYYVDFIQGDNIAATFKCGSQIWDPSADYTVHIPAGTYKISIRTPAWQRYDKGALVYTVVDDANPTSYQDFISGDEVVFASGVYYEIMAGTYVVY